jgi:glutathione S-transferase
MPLTLYYHPLSSFCWKVLIALHETGTRFEGRIVDQSDPTTGAELHSIWPIGKFPVIRDAERGRDLPETTIIIEYIDHYSPRGRALIPLDWNEALDVRFWDRFFDLYVHIPMQKIVGDRMRPEGQRDVTGVADARALLRTAYEILEHRMHSRHWAATEAFSMADCAAAPALFYASLVAPFPLTFARLSAYFEQLLARESFQLVIEQARPYFSLFPFADAIPVRFR